jgi:hypothetical protein
MSVDPVTGDLILFGGYTHDFQYPQDTWSWDGTTWTQLQPATAPPGRAGQAMATGSQLVLFGGYTGSGYLNDTWVWDGSTWIQSSRSMLPFPGPVRWRRASSARWRCSAGRSSWGTSPTGSATRGSGRGRTGAGAGGRTLFQRGHFGWMAFDELDRSVVLFGGAVQGRLNNGTWTLAPS